MPTHINVAPRPIWIRTVEIRRPALWVVFPLMLGLLSLALAASMPAYRDLGTTEMGFPSDIAP